VYFLLWVLPHMSKATEAGPAPRPGLGLLGRVAPVLNSTRQLLSSATEPWTGAAGADGCVDPIDPQPPRAFQTTVLTGGGAA
jgi:hypothetical protein